MSAPLSSRAMNHGRMSRSLNRLVAKPSECAVRRPTNPGSLSGRRDGCLFPTRPDVIRKLKSGEYRLYSRKVDPRTGRRRNLGTFGSRAAAEKHERAVQFFKRRG